jgi:hypothetical protein
MNLGERVEPLQIIERDRLYSYSDSTIFWTLDMVMAYRLPLRLSLSWT